MRICLGLDSRQCYISWFASRCCRTTCTHLYRSQFCLFSLICRHHRTCDIADDGHTPPITTSCCHSLFSWVSGFFLREKLFFLVTPFGGLLSTLELQGMKSQEEELQHIQWVKFALLKVQCETREVFLSPLLHKHPLIKNNGVPNYWQIVQLQTLLSFLVYLKIGKEALFWAKAPTFLWVKFSNPQAGIDKRWTPIFRVNCSFSATRRAALVSQIQFPLRPCAVKTVHKCQGSTWTNSVTDLKSGRTWNRLHYFALSRVMSKKGFVPFLISLVNRFQCPLMSKLKWLVCVHMPSTSCATHLFTITHPQCGKSYSIMARSLHEHLPDIIADPSSYYRHHWIFRIGTFRQFSKWCCSWTQWSIPNRFPKSSCTWHDGVCKVRTDTSQKH